MCPFFDRNKLAESKHVYVLPLTKRHCDGRVVVVNSHDDDDEKMAYKRCFLRQNIISLNVQHTVCSVCKHFFPDADMPMGDTTTQINMG